MNKVKVPGRAALSSNQFPVVGIGASAGGLSAVSGFLDALPARTGMAYVFVQHLSPDHESMLPEILAKLTKIPVHKITDNIHLEPDNLYIIPSNKTVTATDGVLKLAPLNDGHHQVKIIDLFFSSLAVVHQGYAVGIVLSGLLDDGTLGLQAIKAYGGITFAQDEDSAAYDEMPQSAIRTGAVDFVLPPAKIAEHLVSINTPFYEGPESKSASEKNEEIFKQVLALLRVRRGVDFTYYKSSTLKRRIIRRMALNVISKPADYLVYLRENKAEQDALYNDMLISVTGFFRDPDSFELLCTTVLPELFKRKSETESLRIWIAGCASGEEAYSIAICVLEMMGDKTAARKIQIFASDISEIAIDKARAGIYRPADLEGLSASRLQQFFTRQGSNYRINKEPREMCVFAHHNFLKDPPFSKMDIVSCRNVLIYLEPVLQKKALTTFHYALNDHAFLILGKSESIYNNPDLFAAYNHSKKIFLKKGVQGRFMQVTSRGSEQSFKDVDQGVQKGGEQNILKIADDILLSAYTPAGVIVNERYDIIKFRGSVDPWLALPEGKASLNLLTLTREGLSFETRTLLLQAKKTGNKALKEGIVFRSNHEQRYTDIEVIPLADTGDLHYLVLFRMKDLPDTLSLVSGSGEALTIEALRIGQLENELMQARADMRTATEEQEAIYEELQSANQELLSGNEEMQTINEELETSKEELQSTNEEIHIVNLELFIRNEELNSARTYAEGIINTIGDPLLILDKDLRVRRATSGFYTKFKVTSKETEGRYIYDLGNQQWDIPDLRTLLEMILPEKELVTDYQVTHIFPSIGKKIMCLNARQLEQANGDQLILLAIEDITDKRRVEDGLAEVEKLFEESKSRLKLAVDAAGLGTWDFNPFTRELIWDSRCKEMFGLLPSDVVTYDLFIKMVHPDDREDVARVLQQALNPGSNGEYDQEFRTESSPGRKERWVKFKGKAYFTEENIASRFVGTSLDITAERIHDAATNELLKQKDDFMSIASHELKTPITTLQAAIQLLNKLKDNPSHKMFPVLIEQANKSMGKVNILIADLLNVSRLTQGQLHTNKTTFVMSRLVDDCLSHVHTKGIFLVKTVGDLNLEVYADSERIEQILVNFVNNAIKYASDSREILIKIKKAGKMVKVSVTDKGPGIDKEMLPHLFERYYRADSTGSQYSGLGLGLYICAEIIKKHSGEIGVESEVGKGSTFWFTLPQAGANELPVNSVVSAAASA